MYAAEYSIITHMCYIFLFYSSRVTEVAHSERNQVYSYIVIVIIIIIHCVQCYHMPFHLPSDHCPVSHTEEDSTKGNAQRISSCRPELCVFHIVELQCSLSLSSE